MFLHSLGSIDDRFQTLKFHSGLNILLADKAEDSTTQDSRNGAGKSSFVRILRYLLGGKLDQSLNVADLSEHSFWAAIELENSRMEEDKLVNEPLCVLRAVKSGSRISVAQKEISVSEWKCILSSYCGLPDAPQRPTVAQLFAQLARSYFEDPLKTYAAESKWESGMRIGYFLGFSPEILAKAGEIAELEQHRKIINKLKTRDTLGNFELNEGELRAKLTMARNERSKLAKNLSAFKADAQYAEHQAEADRLTLRIRDLNDEALSLTYRERDLALVINQDLEMAGGQQSDSMQAVYAEVGIHLSEAVIRRFQEVAKFHESILRNRRAYLEGELSKVRERLQEVETERGVLDQKRSAVMSLLKESMALETFRSAERDLAQLEVKVADLEQKLERATELNKTDVQLRSMRANAESSLSAEFHELAPGLEAAIELFQELGQEIYADREVSLLINVTKKGTLDIVPKIDGDASAGILGVKIFLLDLVCLITALQLHRAPKILVHDSQLFDSMDDRQIASCLNIGARLAAQYGFQYIVTMNSDRLQAAEAEGFSRERHVIDPVLTDKEETGGLFGFRFQ